MKKNKYIAGKVTGRKMTKAEIKERFDSKVAAGYMKMAVSSMHFMPDHNYAFDIASAYVTRVVPKGAKLLDLGAGTGNFSHAVLKRSKETTITLMDFSSKMLECSPVMLGKYKGRFNTIKSDMFYAQLKKDEYNAVISSLAIHHARGQKVYEELYRKIYSSLKAKGTFVCLDVVRGDVKAIDEFNLEGWSAHLRSCYSKKDIRNMLANYKVEDSPISLRKHMDLLVKAGFRSVDVLWKKNNFAVYVAIK